MALSFQRQIEAFAKKANMSVEKTIRGTSIRLFSAVILSSPVDTGRFRANWQVSGATPASSTVGGFADPTAKVATYVNGQKQSLEFTLANNLPYAYALEYGYSKQAPQGMVRINVARFQRILDEQARINR